MSELVDVSVAIRAETDAAVLVYSGDYKTDTEGKKIERRIWLPKSQIVIDESHKEITVTLPEWLAIEKGLI
jgi:mRNA degradation ribonuclease J1/J2